MRVRTVVIAAILLVAAGTAFLLHQAPRKSAPSPKLPGLNDVVVLRELEFVRPGRSLVRAQELRTRPACLHLYLVIGEQARRIGNPNELVGHVSSIERAEWALQYARLFTGYPIAPDTTPDWLSEVFLQGDPEFARYAPWGLRESEWRANGLKLPSVRRPDDAFVVERYLLARKDVHSLRASTIYRVQETIYPDGRMTRKTLSKHELTGVQIRVPGRM